MGAGYRRRWETDCFPAGAAVGLSHAAEKDTEGGERADAGEDGGSYEDESADK